MNERGLIVRQAGTVLVGQVAVVAFGVIDTLVAGRHSEAALAALSVGSAVYITVFVMLMGLQQALLPVLSELHGANRPDEVGRQFRQSLYLWALNSVVGMLALLWPAPLLHWTDVPEALQPAVHDYLRILAWSLPPALLFRLFSTLNQSLGRPKSVTWIQVMALGLKVPLSFLLALGAGDWAGWGLAGCAYATLAVNSAMILMAAYLLRQRAFYEPYRLWHRLEKPDRRVLWQLARLGIPNALSVTVEVTSFTLMALFIARLGTVASASHQIMTSLAALVYMVPLSFAIATSARVSYWLGAQQPREAIRATRDGFVLVVGFALVLAVMILSLRSPIAQAYTRQPAVALMASGMMAWLALYLLADAIQVMCFFLLRCYRVTLAPLMIYSVLLWGFGLSGGYRLAYQGWGPWSAWQHPVAFWITSSCALVLASVLMATLLRWTQRSREARVQVG
ncbi:MAG: MATE family efflux transporter [Limnohabitans sp.]|nr:MATE family efflux transporter [Limnohabitans sp.]